MMPQMEHSIPKLVQQSQGATSTNGQNGTQIPKERPGKHLKSECLKSPGIRWNENSSVHDLKHVCNWLYTKIMEIGTVVVDLQSQKAAKDMSKILKPGAWNPAGSEPFSTWAAKFRHYVEVNNPLMKQGFDLVERVNASEFRLDTVEDYLVECELLQNILQFFLAGEAATYCESRREMSNGFESWRLIRQKYMMLSQLKESDLHTEIVYFQIEPGLSHRKFYFGSLGASQQHSLPVEPHTLAQLGRCCVHVQPANMLSCICCLQRHVVKS